MAVSSSNSTSSNPPKIIQYSYPIPPPSKNITGQTYIDKPVRPVNITAGQIPIGQGWNFTYPLDNTKSYHVYCYGDWINTTTDYDIYVFDPNGTLVGWHSEARGLPEHLGDNVSYPFFTPKHSGNYTFVVLNDYPESEGTEAATLMVIEHIDTNRWYNVFLEGKDENEEPVFNTTWAFEFNTSSPAGRIEFLVDVPDTLDMYEARLFLMAYPDGGYGEYFVGTSLAWEPGLYGSYALVNDVNIGGYNLNFTGYRGNNFSSCEYPGEDMPFNFTVPYSGNLLYHLGFIAEHGNGTLSFMVRTDFTPPIIHSVSRDITTPNPDEAVEVTANVTDDLAIDQVLLNYFDGSSWLNVSMAQREGVYIATIPALPLNTTVRYRVYASDKVHWVSSTIESYTVHLSVVIGGRFVTDERCDLGSLQTVGLHAIWKHNNSDVVGGNIFINGTEYVTNGTGWVTFDTSYNTVGNRTWIVTGVYCFGVTDYIKNVTNPSIVWDGLEIYEGGVVDDRINFDAGGTFWFKVRYMYDKGEFTNSSGAVLLNGSIPMTWNGTLNRWEYAITFNAIGKKTYHVNTISDGLYGLSNITKQDSVGPKSIVWDRIKIIDGGVSSNQVEINQKATIWFTAVYEYDNTVLDGSKGMLYADGSAMSWSPVNNRWELVYTFTAKGTKGFTVSQVSDSQYNITAFTDMAGSQFIECFVPLERLWTQWWFSAIVGGVTSIVLVFVVGSLYYRRQERRQKRLGTL